MVTHGDVAFKYKDIYYIFYNHSDSYCECLGKIVVKAIKSMILNGNINNYKLQLLRIPLRDEVNDGDMNFYSIYNSIYGYENSVYHTSDYEPSNSYTYTIDFDENEFIITKYNHRYTFYLFDIPENWLEIVERNQNYFYENKEAIKKQEIKNKILELEKEINALKLKLV